MFVYSHKQIASISHILRVTTIQGCQPVSFLLGNEGATRPEPCAAGWVCPPGTSNQTTRDSSQMGVEANEEGRMNLSVGPRRYVDVFFE